MPRKRRTLQTTKTPRNLQSVNAWGFALSAEHGQAEPCFAQLSVLWVCLAIGQYASPGVLAPPNVVAPVKARQQPLTHAGWKLGFL
jgi:hypothetical protein